MGDWNGYFSGDSTAIYGNAYSINLDSTYQFRTSAGGADAVTKKLGEPVRRTINVIQELNADGGTINVDVSYNGYRPVCAGISSFRYNAATNDNSTETPVSLCMSGNTVTIKSTTKHTAGWCSFNQIVLEVTYESV